MTVYHPIFDDKSRIWDLDVAKLDILELERKFGGVVEVALTKKGQIAQLRQHGNYYIGTKNCAFPGHPHEPRWEHVSEAFWRVYIVPHIYVPSMIDMTGEFDGDDIELAQIIMDELEGR